MDYSYMSKSIDDVHGDEHLLDDIVHDKDCIGSPDIWCTCLERREQEAARIQELSFLDHEDWRD